MGKAIRAIRRRYGFVACAVLAVFVVMSGCGRDAEKTPGTPRESTAPVAPATAPRVGLLPDGAPKPNIIMILVDALRADRLGVYGHPGHLTPTLDEIASDGVVFERCMAPAPWTMPSVASLFVSYHPSVHKMLRYKAQLPLKVGDPIVAYQSVLSEDFNTMAELLRARGYQTAGFCANGMIRKDYGMEQGFEYYDASFAANDASGALVNAAADKWLAQQRDSSRPLFLYLHYMDVHGPYDAGPEFLDPLLAALPPAAEMRRLTGEEFRAIDGYMRKPPPVASDPSRYKRLKMYLEYWTARYDAGVKAADHYVRLMRERLRERGLWDDAYVILLSDHGEHLCEHGLWSHGGSLYEPLLHVPLALRWPDVLPAEKRVHEFANLMDILPTLLEQLRIRSPEPLQGVSLLGPLNGDSPAGGRVLFFEGDEEIRRTALRVGDMKLLLTRPKMPATAPSTADVALFDLANDPGELTNLAEQRPDTVQALRAMLRERVAANGKIRPDIAAHEAEVAPDIVERLRDLGYVGGADHKTDRQPGGPPTDDGSKPAVPKSQH
jgi:arylsulfatase